MTIQTIGWRFAIMVLLALIPVSTPASAADKSEEEARCERKVSGKGYPNLIKSIASLSALRSWSQRANNMHGADYSMWHNAEGQDMDCEQKANSDFYVCIASGKPCKAMTAKSPSKQAQKRPAPKGL